MRHEASRYELEMNNKNKINRDLHSGFKRDYQLKSNLVNDENGDLVADSQNIF
jgi:hypothetical protein